MTYNGTIKIKSELFYETPNKQFRVHKCNNISWEEVFGVEIIIYLIYKIKPMIEDLNDSSYQLVHSTEKPETAFRWLRWNKIISSDEMRHQISLLTELKE